MDSLPEVNLEAEPSKEPPKPNLLRVTPPVPMSLKPQSNALLQPLQKQQQLGSATGELICIKISRILLKQLVITYRRCTYHFI